MQEIMHVTVMISIIQYFGGGQNTYYAANKKPDTIRISNNKLAAKNTQRIGSLILHTK